MGYSPMAAGILTGKYRKGERGRATDLKASVQHADDPNNYTAIDAVSAVAKEVGAKPGQVAVALVKAKGVLPIVGTRLQYRIVIPDLPSGLAHARAGCATGPRLPS